MPQEREWRAKAYEVACSAFGEGHPWSGVLHASLLLKDRGQEVFAASDLGIHAEVRFHSRSSFFVS